MCIRDSLRAVRESPGQSNEFLARKAQAVEDRYGIVLFHRAEPVSYTHLDVYKRQVTLCFVGRCA